MSFISLRPSARSAAPRFLAPATAMALCLAAIQPGAAFALTAPEAWANLQSMAAGAGLTMTSTGMSGGDASVTVSGLRIFPTANPNDLIISMDTLRVEPQGEMITLAPSAQVDLAILFAGGLTRHFTVTHDGTITGNLTETNAALDLDFPTLSLVQVPGSVTLPGGKGGSVADPLSVSVQFQALDASLRAAREGAAELSLRATSVSYDVTYPDPATEGATVSQMGTLATPAVRFTGTELDMLSDEEGALRRAFDSGFSARLEFTSGASAQTSRQMVEGMAINMQTQGGSSEMVIEAANGRVDISGTAEALSMSGNYGPIPGSVTLAGMSMAFGLPLVVTPGDQAMRYMISLEDVAPSAELLAMVGAGQFAGEQATVTLDLGAQGRLTREIGPDFGEGDAPPFDVSSVALNDLRLQVGDSALTGSGAVALIGGLMGQIGQARPNADGRFLFDLVGGERLLTRLQGMGLVPQDQLFFVRMMMNGLSRPVGDDHLQSEVVLQPGGTVTVNGAPLPF